MFRFVVIGFLLLTGACYADEPWGKDADLLGFKHRCSPCPEQKHDGLLVRMTRSVIGFHKGVISPADGPRSHYKPSSSEYMLQAVEKYGFFYGYLLGCDRLMRENKDPWLYRTTENKYHLITKWDPVP